MKYCTVYKMTRNRNISRLILLSNCRKSFGCRHYCEKKSNEYSKSVFLPKTTFPLRLDGNKRKEMDEYILKKCDFKNMYRDWESSCSTDKTFVLHDGPPYANGSPHIGHAINKILKDMVNRTKFLQGYRVNYVPGWDCYGLPIELKATSKDSQWSYEKQSNVQEILNIRNKAKTFANNAINIQREAFERWGVIANWENCYYTFDKKYVADQFSLFYQLYEKNYVYKAIKPVYWSPASRTALAEAELEYNSHKSTSIYFKCLLKSSTQLFGIDKVNALIWTTTPWTVPCNKAVCYSQNKKYCVVKCNESGENYLIAIELKSDLEAILSKCFTVLREIDGELLKEVHYYHPLTNEELPFLPGKHVTTDIGTGLVHTAPAHGPDDFLIAIENEISVECLVDEDGKYTKDVCSSLEGKRVLDEGNRAVIELLNDNVVKIQDYVHNYPYDWRTKTPVIIRASSQWFFDSGRIKSKAVEFLNEINFYPAEAKMSMISLLENRPYWCISRQRVWGVPIPVFYNAETNETLINKQIVNHLIGLLDKYGADFWWTLSDDKLLPRHLLNEIPENKHFERGKDIFDIWFDSGSSWNTVLKEFDGQSDFYIEGIDQITGWFQSSLLLSSALKNKAPYKNLYIHGFAIDDKGKKMSKSLGNVVDPNSITDGSPKGPCYGADVLRWWVAAHGGGHSTVPIGPNILKNCYDDVQKLRIVIRYLLGILHNFKPPEEVHLSSLVLIDQYMLHQIFKFKEEVTETYKLFLFYRVTTLIKKFVNDDVSAFYCHLIKDRVYCESEEDWKRQSALIVANYALTVILQILSPILPFLTEEAHLSYSNGEKPYLSKWSLPTMNNWENVTLSKTVDVLKAIRYDLNKLATSNGISLRDFNLTIFTDSDFGKELNMFQLNTTSNDSGLTEFFLVPEVTIVLEKHPGYSVDKGSYFCSGPQCDLLLQKCNSHACPRCRRRTSNYQEVLCDRCKGVIETQKNLNSDEHENVS